MHDVDLKRSPGLAREQARLIVASGLRNGLSLTTCLNNTGLCEQSFYQFEEDVSVACEIQLIKNVLAEVKKDPFSLGFELGLECGLHSLGAIGHALLASESIFQAVGIAQRYFTVAYHFINFRLTKTTDTFKFCLDLNDDFGEAINSFLLARDIGIIANVHKMAFADEPKNIKEFSFAGAYRPGMGLVSDFFDCPVLVNQSENSYISLIKNLSQPMPHSNSVTANLLEQVCYRHLDKLPVAPITPLYKDKVWLVLNDSRNPNITLKEVAEQIKISDRTLGRYLQKENASWNTLKSEYKFYKARTLLSESNYSIKDIAEHLGFSTETAFSRAFENQCGSNPTDFRRAKLN